MPADSQDSRSKEEIRMSISKRASKNARWKKLINAPASELTRSGIFPGKRNIAAEKKKSCERANMYYRSKKLGIDLKAVMNGAKQELARRHFWDFCNYMAPDFYIEKRKYLREICDSLEEFEEDANGILIVNAPPRFGKSRTSCLYVEWLLGKNAKYRVMTGSYNETLSTIFSKNVRNTIGEVNGKYSSVFPATRIKYGDGAMNLWSLEGSETNNYLATSPTGTATGFGADFIIIDDLIKSAYEANNPTILENHWQWFTNTIYSRLEGKRKIMLFMTQWSADDLPHRVKAHFESIGVPVRQIEFGAMNPDGTMLDSSILPRSEYENKRNTLAPEIFETNYNNKVIETIDSLYDTDRIRTYQPEDRYYLDADGERQDKFRIIKSRVDTADEGTDALVKIVYSRVGDYVYIIDILHSTEKMESTEAECARIDKDSRVNLVTTESNNGGKGFARFVEEKTRALGNTLTEYVWKPTTANKESRIITNSTGIINTFVFPTDWKTRFRDYYIGMKSYKRTGGNKHDDDADCTTAVYEDEFVKRASIRF